MARDRFLRCALAAAACALPVAVFSAPRAAAAGAADLRIQAVPGGRVSVRMIGRTASSAHEFVLDGHEVLRTRRLAVTLFVPRGRVARGALAQWHRLEVRPVGSRRVVGRARFAMGVSRSRAAPTLVLLGAPPARTPDTVATLRFSVSNRHASCSHDGSPFERCASPATYKGLSPGAHSFTIRAANRRGRAAVRVASTVLAPASDAPPAASPPTPSPAPGPEGRRLVSEDDFDGTALNTTIWSPYNSAGNAGNGLRRASAISLDGAGHLVISAETVNGQLVSGGMSERQNYTYGWFEFRVRTDPDPTGTMSGVVLTWPESGRWPVDGENDIYETGAGVGTRYPFHSYVHYGTANNQYRFTHDADGAQWHTMAMDWRPDAIRFYRDGSLAASLTDAAAIPHTAHHLCVQLDARATRALTTPVRMYVDYVRIYQ
jgi:beta-glucanase (GH16 family)